MKKVRQTNIELLRIIAMIMVLILHADYFSLGAPTLFDISERPMTSIVRIVIESMSIVAVNAFVLISGWFGIHPTLRRFSSFMFQVVFFVIAGSVIAMLFGDYGARPLGGWLLLLLGWNYWFVKAYIILYLFSPILNVFIENVSKQQLLKFIIFFYAMQTIYGWYLGDGGYFQRGYSPLSMMGLYLLARYIRIYGDSFKRLNWFVCFCLYLIVSILIAVLEFSRLQRDVEWYILEYSNPLVIVSSVCLFLSFARMELNYSKVINYISVSSFAAYLFHFHEDILYRYYMKFINHWFETNDFLHFFIYTGFWIILIFVSAVCIDQIRIVIWALIDKITKCHFLLKIKGENVEVARMFPKQLWK